MGMLRGKKRVFISNRRKYEEKWGEGEGGEILGCGGGGKRVMVRKQGYQQGWDWREGQGAHTSRIWMGNRATLALANWQLACEKLLGT